MKLDVEQIQSDLREGFRKLLELLKNIAENAVHESGKVGFRLRRNKLEKQLESCYQEIGRRAHLLVISKGLTDFSHDTEITRLMEQVSELIDESEKLSQEVHEEGKESLEEQDSEKKE